MKRMLLFVALVSGLTLGLGGLTFGHGGQYRGPGDTVPPGGGGGGGGGGPSSPGPSGPGSPGPSGPSSPGPVGPGSPGAGPSGPSSGPVSGGGGQPGPDLTAWTFWWEFNKEPYLNLKDNIHSGGVSSGSDSFFLGMGQKDQAKSSLRPSENQIRQQIVPALLAALETETNNDIVTGCMIALAKIGDPKTEDGSSQMEPVLKKFLQDSNQEISETAAVSLGILAADAAVSTLTDLLLDSSEGRKLVGQPEVNYRTRAFAGYGLGLIGAKTDDESVRQEIVKNLIEAIDTDATKQRDLKVAAIVALGLVPLDTLTAELAEGEEAAPHNSRMATVDYLMTFLKDEGRQRLNRAHVATAVVRLLDGVEGAEAEAKREEVAKDFLGRLTKSSKESNEVKQSIALALGKLGDLDPKGLDADIRKSLMAVPKQISDRQARFFSMISIAQLGARLGESTEIEKSLGEVSKYLSGQLVKAKGDTGPWAGLAMGVFGAGLQDLENAGPEVSGAVSAAQTAVRSKLKDEKSAGRVGAYAVAAGIMQDREAEEILVQKMTSLGSPEAQGYCAVALGLMDATSAKEEIRKLVGGSKYKPDLLKQAAIGLGLMGDKAVVQELITMLEDAPSLATQAALASALGFIGDRDSVDPLVTMLENKDLTDVARGFAAVALGIVADKELLPWNAKIATDLNYRASTTTLNQPDSGNGIINIL